MEKARKGVRSYCAMQRSSHEQHKNNRTNARETVWWRLPSLPKGDERKKSVTVPKKQEGDPC